MKLKSKICSFTGYRPQKLPFGFDENRHSAVRLKEIIRTELEKLINDGYDTFQTGMALGTDIICAEIVISLSEEYRNIKLNAVIPCLNQSKTWGDTEKKRYDNILSHCDQRITVSECDYFNGCMQKRNRWLAENCDCLFAVYNGKAGGTQTTVEYAQKLGKKIIAIDPDLLLRTELVSQLDFFE